MGLFDELGKALKKVQGNGQMNDTDKHLKGVEHGLNKAGKEIGAEFEKARSPRQTAQAPAPANPPATAPRGWPLTGSPHPGYQKIAAWVKSNYRNRIHGATGDRYQQGLQLEQLTAEACSGLPAKARKGFMEYLKKQNYEPLLK